LVLAVPENRSPIAPINEVPEIGRRDLIGGLIREYHAVAGTVAFAVEAPHQGDSLNEIAPTPSPPTGTEFGLRRIPIPA